MLITLALVVVFNGASAEARSAGHSDSPPDVLRTLRQARRASGRSGWADQKALDFETLPNETLAAQAIARRPGTGDGKRWGVPLLQAGEATLDKRGAPVGKFFSSLCPQGNERESFAGRAARPLTTERVTLLKASCWMA